MRTATVLSAAMLIVSGSSAHAQFTFAKAIDRITDEDRSHISTQSLDGSGTLSFFCEGAELGVLFSFEQPFAGHVQGGWRTVDVQFRFPPVQAMPQRRWLLTTGRTAARIPLPDDVAAFTKQALTFRTVVLRATDVDGEMVTREFSLSGLHENLRQLACAASVAVPR